MLEREAKEIPIDLEAAQTTTTTTSTALTTTTTVPQTTTRTTTTELPRTSTSKGPWMAVGVTTLAVGGIGLVVGGITGALSLSQTSTIKSQCPNGMCPPMLSDGTSTTTALGNARTMATVSDVGFIAGGVVAALGAAFVIVAATKKPQGMALRIGPGSFELGGRF